jgi:hypothetical protein
VRYHQAHGLDRRDLPKANGIAGLDWQTIVHSNFDPQRFSAAVANRARPQQGFEYEHKKGRGMNTEYDDLGDFAEVCRQADAKYRPRLVKAEDVIPRLALSSAESVSGFVPPDYLIEGFENPDDVRMR